MFKTKLTPLSHIAFLAAIVFLPNTAMALNIDLFCLESCNPTQCATKSIKEQCQKKCTDWKSVGRIQMSKESIEFRKEDDKQKKEAMLYDSPIAKCLDKKAEAETELEAKPLTPTAAAGAAAMHPHVSEDLCTAAIKKEMDALKNDKMLTDTQIEAQIKNLEAGLKASQSEKVD